MDYHTNIPQVDETLDARFESLSRLVQNIINGNDITDLSDSIAQIHNLDTESRVGLGREILMTLMLFTPVEQFEESLIREHLIPREVAQAINVHVNDQLFSSLQNELAHVGTGPDEEGQTVPETLPASKEMGSVTPTSTTQTPETLGVQSSTYVAQTPIPQQAPVAAPHIAPSIVMPQSAEQVAVQHDPKGSTALPNALLQNLKASLMHGSITEEPLEGTGPKASYNALLGGTPPQP